MTRFLMLVFAILMFGSVSLPTSTVAHTDGTVSPCNWKTASAGNSAVQDKTDLAGRLGSTRDQFEALYGQPLPSTNPALGPEYKIDGCGEVFATFDPDGYLISLSIYSPAPPDRKHLEDPDPADWSTLAAFQVATSFVPLDTGCSDPGIIPNPLGYVIYECSSSALRNQVPQSSWDYSDATPTYGSFIIVLHTNKETGIYGIDLELRFDVGDFPPA